MMERQSTSQERARIDINEDYGPPTACPYRAMMVEAPSIRNTSC